MADVLGGERGIRSRIEMLRAGDIAPQLGVSRSRVYQLMAAGLLPAIRQGRSLRIPRRAWEQWLRYQENQALGIATDLKTVAPRSRAETRSR